MIKVEDIHADAVALAYIDSDTEADDDDTVILVGESYESHFL